MPQIQQTITIACSLLQEMNVEVNKCSKNVKGWEAKQKTIEGVIKKGKHSLVKKIAQLLLDIIPQPTEAFKMLQLKIEEDAEEEGSLLFCLIQASFDETEFDKEMFPFIEGHSKVKKDLIPYPKDRVIEHCMWCSSLWENITLSVYLKEETYTFFIKFKAD